MPTRVIIIDNREKLPYDFGGLPTVVRHLATGDYSLDGLEDRVAVERKSKEDFYGCVGKRRIAFEKCLARLALFESALVVIEADLESLAEPPPYTTLNAAQAVGSYISWHIKFSPVQFILAGNRVYAERVVVRFLEAYEKHRSR